MEDIRKMKGILVYRLENVMDNELAMETWTSEPYIELESCEI